MLTMLPFMSFCAYSFLRVSWLVDFAVNSTTTALCENCNWI